MKLGEATQCVQAKDRQLMMKEFPTSYGLPLVKLEPKGAPVSHSNTTTSGRQAGRCWWLTLLLFAAVCLCG